MPMVVFKRAIYALFTLFFMPMMAKAIALEDISSILNSHGVPNRMSEQTLYIMTDSIAVANPKCQVPLCRNLLRIADFLDKNITIKLSPDYFVEGEFNPYMPNDIKLGTDYFDYAKVLQLINFNMSTLRHELIHLLYFHGSRNHIFNGSFRIPRLIGRDIYAERFSLSETLTYSDQNLRSYRREGFTIPDVTDPLMSEFLDFYSNFKETLSNKQFEVFETENYVMANDNFEKWIRERTLASGIIVVSSQGRSSDNGEKWRHFLIDKENRMFYFDSDVRFKDIQNLDSLREAIRIGLQTIYAARQPNFEFPQKLRHLRKKFTDKSFTFQGPALECSRVFN